MHIHTHCQSLYGPSIGLPTGTQYAELPGNVGQRKTTHKMRLRMAAAEPAEHRINVFSIRAKSLHIIIYDRLPRCRQLAIIIIN